MRRKTLFATLVLAILLTMRATPASAEFFADAYLGPAFTQDDRWAGAPTKFDDVFSFGGRLGYYFGFWPYLGVAVDVSHFQPDGKFGGIGSGFSFDGKVTGVSFDAMLRFPVLTSSDFPIGRLQPYLTAGPGVYFSRFRVRPFGGSDSSTDPGLKLGAGLAWMFHRNVGLLGEYRYSRLRAEYQGFDTDIDTHRLQFGVTLRF